MSWVRRRGKRWQVCWRDPDGTERGRTVATRKAADALRREVDETVGQGRRWEPRDARPVPGLAVMLDDYLAECRLRNAASTVTRKQQMVGPFARYVVDHYGRGARPEVLSRRLLVAYHAHLLDPETGRYIHGRGSETARKHVLEIEQAWAWCWERADEYGVHVPRPQRLRIPRQRTPHRAQPTWAEMDACIDALRGWRRRVAVVMRCTGLRVGQVMALRWDDLDLDRATLRVRPELGKMPTEKRGRIVPVAPTLVEAVAGWGRREGWLVECPHAHRTVRARDMERAWKRAGVRVEAWKHRPNHAFRGGFQTELRAAGARWEAVEYLVGHALPGVGDAYHDPARLGCVEAVGMVPALGSVRMLPSNGCGHTADRSADRVDTADGAHRG